MFGCRRERESGFPLQSGNSFADPFYSFTVDTSSRMRWSNEPTASCGSRDFARRIRRRRVRGCRRYCSMTCITPACITPALIFLFPDVSSRWSICESSGGQSTSNKLRESPSTRDASRKRRDAGRVRPLKVSGFISESSPRASTLPRTQEGLSRLRHPEALLGERLLAAHGRRYDLSTSSGAYRVKDLSLYSLHAPFSVQLKNRQLGFARGVDPHRSCPPAITSFRFVPPPRRLQEQPAMDPNHLLQSSGQLEDFAQAWSSNQQQTSPAAA